MKQIIVNGTVLYEVRPGVYESAGPGVILREHNTGEIIKARRQELHSIQAVLEFAAAESIPACWYIVSGPAMLLLRPGAADRKKEESFRWQHYLSARLNSQ